MIKIYYRSTKHTPFQILEKPKRGAWIAVESPTVDELEQLAEQYQLDLGHLNDAIDPDEVPRTEKEGEQTYIFTRVPVTSGESLSTRTILFIITKQYIFTVSTDHFSLFEKILTTPQSIVTTHRVSFLASCFFPIIASYNSNVTAINKKLYKMRAGLDEITKKQIVDFIIYEEQLNDILNSVTRTNLILHTLLNGRSLPNMIMSLWKICSWPQSRLSQEQKIHYKQPAPLATLTQPSLPTT